MLETVTKEKIKKAFVIIGLVLLSVIGIGVPLSLVFGNTSTNTTYTTSKLQEINQLRYDYILAYGDDKKAIGKVLKNKIQSLPVNVATTDMLDLLKIID